MAAQILFWDKFVTISALVFGFLFVVQYTAYSPWWRDPIGRTVVAMDLAIFCALLPLVLGTFFHFTYREELTVAWISIGALGAVSVIEAWRMVVWYFTRKRVDPFWKEPFAAAAVKAFRYVTRRKGK